MVIGFIIGAGAGFLLSIFFIFPNDILSLKLAAITIGDLLRIFGGLVVTATLGAIGAVIGVAIGEAAEKEQSLAASKKRFISKEEEERLAKDWGLPEYHEARKREKERRKEGRHDGKTE